MSKSNNTSRCMGHLFVSIPKQLKYTFGACILTIAPFFLSRLIPCKPSKESLSKELDSKQCEYIKIRNIYNDDVGLINEIITDKCSTFIGYARSPKVIRAIELYRKRIKASTFHLAEAPRLMKARKCSLRDSCKLEKLHEELFDILESDRYIESFDGLTVEDLDFEISSVNERLCNLRDCAEAYFRQCDISFGRHMESGQCENSLNVSFI